MAGTEGDVLQELPEGHEGVAQQQLLVLGDRVVGADLGTGDHEDLREREGDPLAQLVRPGDCVPEEGRLGEEGREVVAVAGVRRAHGAHGVHVVGHHRIGPEIRRRRLELRVDPRRRAALLDVVNHRGGRTEGRLCREPDRVRREHQRRNRSRRLAGAGAERHRQRRDPEDT